MTKEDFHGNHIKFVSLEESEKLFQEHVSGWEKEETDESALASISLLKNVGPVWSRWIKESGAKSPDILIALENLCAGLICEAAANVAKPGKAEEVCHLMVLDITKKCEAGMKVIMSGKIKDTIPAFRRTDA